jgi:hypothetical protein
MRGLPVLALLGMLSPSALAQTHVAQDTVRMENEKEIARERAIIPYIEKARSTYPAAKKRFLTGLPSGCLFAVMVRLHGSDEAKKQVIVDDAFVVVDSIKNGKIVGRINSPVFIPGYRQGQQISFPESEIINWAIAHPDGSEEGNYVGKFMDHYKPK